MSPRCQNEMNMLSRMMIPTVIMQKQMIYLVLTIHETNFSATNSNISSWDIGGWTNIATKLRFIDDAVVSIRCTGDNNINLIIEQPPTCVMKDSQKRLISASDFPFGSKSEPPLHLIASIAMNHNVDNNRFRYSCFLCRKPIVQNNNIGKWSHPCHRQEATPSERF